MTPKKQQARRKQLHAMTTASLETFYGNLSGRLPMEVRRMFIGLDDEGRQIMIDSIIRRENDS